MLHRRPFKQLSTLEDRLAEEAINLRKQAEGMPLSIRRDELMRKANQMDTGELVVYQIQRPVRFIMHPGRAFGLASTSIGARVPTALRRARRLRTASPSSR